MATFSKRKSNHRGIGPKSVEEGERRKIWAAFGIHCSGKRDWARGNATQQIAVRFAVVDCGWVNVAHWQVRFGRFREARKK